MHASPKGWGTKEAVAAGDLDSSSLSARIRTIAGGALLLVMSWSTWLRVGRDDLALLLGDNAAPQAFAITAWAALASRIGWQAIEAGFYVLVWRALARRVRFGPLFTGIAVLSTLDAVGNVLVRQGAGEPEPWVVALAGARALSDSLAGHSGLDVAFGGFGVLTLLRLFGTAWLQSRERVPMRAALGLTAAAWAAGRLMTWWTTDLMRGMSPLP